MTSPIIIPNADVAQLIAETAARDARSLTVTMHDDRLDVAHPLTITGARVAVLRAVALLSGLSGEDAVAIRPCTVDDDALLVVDAAQADSYPAFLAEVVQQAREIDR